MTDLMHIISINIAYMLTCVMCGCVTLQASNGSSSSASSEGLQYYGASLSLLYLGYDRPCNSITIDATAVKVAGTGKRKKHAAESMQKVC
jgi:hypothetical protein